MSIKKSSNSSLVLEFFTVCDNPTKAKCKCSAIYTREKTLKTYSMKSLLNHTKKRHRHEHADLKLKPDEPSSNSADMMDLTTAESLTGNLSEANNHCRNI